MASLRAKVRAKGGHGREKEGQHEIVPLGSGRASHPLNEIAQRPTPLDARLYVVLQLWGLHAHDIAQQVDGT